MADEEQARKWWSAVKEACAAEALRNPEAKQVHMDAIAIHRHAAALAAERERCRQSLAIYHENKHDAIVRDLERGDITIEQGLRLAGQAAAHRESAAAIRALGDER